MDDRQLEAALAYLQENAGRFSVEALRGELLRAGYGPELVNRAIRDFGESHPEVLRHSTSIIHSCGLALLVGFVLCVVVGLLAFGFCYYVLSY